MRPLGRNKKNPRARPFESFLSLETGCSWRGYSFVYGCYLLCSVWVFYNRTERSLPDVFSVGGKVVKMDFRFEFPHRGNICHNWQHFWSTSAQVFSCLDRHFRTSGDNEQMNVIFHMRKTYIWVKLFLSNQFQQIHLCFSMSSINILLHCGGLFTGLQSCLPHRCFMSR